MSHKKIDFGDLSRLKKKILSSSHDYETPVLKRLGSSLTDFSKVLYGSRNAIIEFPTEIWRFSSSFCSILCAMRMAFHAKKEMVFCASPATEKTIESFYEGIVSPNRRLKRSDRIYHSGWGRINPRLITNENYDDYVFELMGIDDGDIGEVMELVGTLVETIRNNHLEHDKRIIVLYPHVINEKSNIYADEYGKFKKKYLDEFIFIDYAREREIVDLWMNKDGLSDTGFLDPEFDMKLAEPGLNLNYMFNYMATNYPESYKEYARFNEEYVGKHMDREDLKFFIGGKNGKRG